MKLVKKVIIIIFETFDKKTSVDLGICDYSGQGRGKYGF